MGSNPTLADFFLKKIIEARARRFVSLFLFEVQGQCMHSVEQLAFSAICVSNNYRPS